MKKNRNCFCQWNCSRNRVQFPLACDIGMASDLASFSETFTKREVHPDWGGINFLPRSVGYTRAAELIFSKDHIDVQKTLRIGLVNGVVPHETLQTKTQDLSRRIARNGSLPITLAKRGLQHFEG